MKGMRPSPCWNGRGVSWRQTGQPFDVALAVTRAGNLFTTHTAVAAGFDRFAPALIEQYLGGYAAAEAWHHAPRSAGARPPEPERPGGKLQHGLSGDPRQRRGQWRQPPAWRGEPAPLCSRCFRAGRQDEVPVGHVTNGVHMPTWDSAAADDALDARPAAKDRWLGTTETMEQDIRQRLRCQALAIPHCRQHGACRLRSPSGCPGNWPRPARSPEAIDAAKHLFDPNTLTLGFARRFATYKRPNLLLHDPERLLRLLTNPQRPVQLIMAGKAHPADQAGPGPDPGMDRISSAGPRRAAM